MPSTDLQFLLPRRLRGGRRPGEGGCPKEAPVSHRCWAGLPSLCRARRLIALPISFLDLEISLSCFESGDIYSSLFFFL